MMGGLRREAAGPACKGVIGHQKCTQQCYSQGKEAVIASVAVCLSALWNIN